MNNIFLKRFSRRIAPLLLVLTAIGCSEIEIQDNQRILFNLRVVDTLGQGIEAVQVNALAVKERIQFFGGDEKLLGQGRSNTDGTVNLVALAPKFENFIFVLVNTASTDEFNPIVLDDRFGSVLLLVAQDDNQLEYNFPETVLRENSLFTVRFERSPTTTSTLEYRIAFEQRRQFINLSNLEDPFPPSFPESGVISPTGASSQEVIIETLLASEVILDITLTENGVSTTEKIVVPVRQANQTYVYDY
jgi:hypothetical protein